MDHTWNTNQLSPSLDARAAYGASLKLFTKPGAPAGHHSSYRPIAMGECLLKVAGLLALEKVREHLPTFFQGLQFGAQYTQGCEHIIHSVRKHFRDRPDEIIVAADLENAFNISRSVIFRALEGDPKLLPLEGITLFSYGKASSLHLGEGTSIISSRGVKQGDPMAPILFAIGIHGAIAKVAAKFPGTLKVWASLDNVTFAGEPKVCGAALEAMQGEIKSLGLNIPFEHKAEGMQAKAKCVLQGLPQGQSTKDQRRSLCEAALLKGPSTTQLVCMRQIQNVHSTKWMNAWPNRPEYYMWDPQWETTARLRYLVARTSEPELQCVCGATLRNEEFCVHALDCKKVKGKTQASRHKEVKEAFRNLLIHYASNPKVGLIQRFSSKLWIYQHAVLSELRFQFVVHASLTHSVRGYKREPPTISRSG